MRWGGSEQNTTAAMQACPGPAECGKARERPDGRGTTNGPTALARERPPQGHIAIDMAPSPLKQAYQVHTSRRIARCRRGAVHAGARRHAGRRKGGAANTTGEWSARVHDQHAPKGNDPTQSTPAHATAAHMLTKGGRNAGRRARVRVQVLPPPTPTHLVTDDAYEHAGHLSLLRLHPHANVRTQHPT
jgi:hypothetical protein